MSNIADESGQSGDDVSIKRIVESESDDRVVAIVRGNVVEQLPDDLYIPPDAVEVVLEAFEGPLDLLLYLIRRQNLDVLEIRVMGLDSTRCGHGLVIRRMDATGVRIDGLGQSVHVG